MEELLVEVTDRVATVTLQRPARKNAVTRAMWAEIAATFTDLGRDDAIRAVILTGAGGDFCSGADVGDMAGDGDADVADHNFQVMRRVGAACQAIFDIPKITIARVDGVAVGAGLNMALACDVVVATDRARFAEIFSKRALSVDFGGSWLLPRIIGLQRAKEMVLFAEMYDAAEALELGLVNRVVSADRLDETVDEFAGRACLLPPRAIASSKALLHRAFSGSLSEALEHEAVAQSFNFTTTDTTEAMRAFRSGSEPEFTGW